MNPETGELYNSDEIEALDDAAKAALEGLTEKEYNALKAVEAMERPAALKHRRALEIENRNKALRRAKNKAARQARRQNR